MVISKSLAEEFELPVSFTSDGKIISLREFITNKDKHHLSLSSLTSKQKVDIVVERLSHKPEVKLEMVGAGEIDKERAITEVKAQSPVGKALIEIEQYVIEKLIDEVKYGRLKGIINSNHAV